MNNPRISLIAAFSENRVLGKDNRLLWNIPNDQKRFKKITLGHVVIMGRKTYESIGRLLPNRTNIIISREPKSSEDSGIFVTSLEEALEKAREIEKEEVFIIGGGQIYSEAISLADKLYLTIVKGNFEGDVFFPDYSEFKKIVYQQEETSNNYSYSYLDLEK